MMGIITGQTFTMKAELNGFPAHIMVILDQHTVLTPGRTMRDALRDAFFPLYKKEEELNEIAGKMADATPEELEALLEEMAEIQDALDAGDFYTLDMKIEEVARGLGLDAIGLDRDVCSTFRWSAYESFISKTYY